MSETTDPLTQAAELLETPDAKPKHTPGEWLSGTTDEGVPFIKPGGEKNATAWPWFCAADMEEAEGEDLMNGLLMAASPELLKVAQELLRYERGLEGGLSHCVRLAKAAIAKALTPPAVIAEQVTTPPDP
jgi:hypothetical protein